MNISLMPRFGSRFKLTIDPKIVEATQKQTGQYLNPLENTMLPFNQELNTTSYFRCGKVYGEGEFSLMVADYAGFGIMAKDKTVLDFVVLDVLDKLLLKHLNAALEKAGLPNRVTLNDRQKLAPITQDNLELAQNIADLDYKLP